MKRLFLFLAICSAIFPGKAYTVLNTATGEIEETTTIPTVSKTVENLANGIKETYAFEKILLTEDPLLPGTYYPSVAL